MTTLRLPRPRLVLAFTLVAFTLAGCSGSAAGELFAEETDSGDPRSDADPESDASPDPNVDRGKDGASGAGLDTEDAGADLRPSCAAAGKFDEAALESTLGGSFRGPGPAQPFACTEGDLANLDANLQSLGPNLATLEGDLSDSCVACAFSGAIEPTWAPIVYLTADKATAFINYGACPAVINGSTPCGEAHAYADLCLRETCGACGSAIEACLDWARAPGGRCAKYTEKLDTSLCPNRARANFTCGTSLVQHVRALCGAR